MGKCVDLVGKKFGRLLVIEKTDKRDITGGVVWKCKCDCGNITFTTSHSLTTSHCRSCGCYKIDFNREQGKTNFTKHGMKHTRLYNTWCNIKQRCYGIDCKNYKNYGARGIKVCDEWLNDFMCFYNWAMDNGYNNELTIDRVDVNGNYEPSNCRWATMTEQANNKTTNHYVLYKGAKMTVKQLSDKYGIAYRTLLCRINRGWDVEKAVNTPIKGSDKNGNKN